MTNLLHDVLKNSLKSYPSKNAIINENWTCITYKELNILSNKFANLFLSLKKNIKKNPYIWIISPVSQNSVACILWILKIWWVYIPLDEYSPYDRLINIVLNSRLDIVAVDSYWYNIHKDLLNHKLIKKILIINDEFKNNYNSKKIIKYSEIKKNSIIEPSVSSITSDNLAYILHSSGSTGVPKGIMLTHLNACSFVDWAWKEINIKNTDIIISRWFLKFDHSIFDIFNSLKAWATLVCFDWNKKRDSSIKHIDYVNLMEKEKVSILYATPSTFNCLLNRWNLQKVKQFLKTIIIWWEAFCTSQIRKLHISMPNTNIINLYWHTETNTLTYYWIKEIPSDNNQPIPIWYILDDTEVIVVREDKKTICWNNEIWEIWCRGWTVTPWYFWLLNKTKEHKILSPFHNNKNYKIYYWRTWDYWFKDKNNCFHFRWRKDHLVKVKWYRIELWEVENAISWFEWIDEFVVVTKPDEKYTNRLYCYYSILNDYKIDENNLINYIKKKLPEYMIPFKFISLKELPKTSSWKIDRYYLSKLND